jgi:hypothetical protein
LEIWKEGLAQALGDQTKETRGMRTSEKMNKRVNHFLENIRDETLVPATSTEILQWLNEVETLEYLILQQGHLPFCVQFQGPYDLGELEPACNCGQNNYKLS